MLNWLLIESASSRVFCSEPSWRDRMDRLWVMFSCPHLPIHLQAGSASRLFQASWTFVNILLTYAHRPPPPYLFGISFRPASSPMLSGICASKARERSERCKISISKTLRHTNGGVQLYRNAVPTQLPVCCSFTHISIYPNFTALRRCCPSSRYL